MPSDRYSEAGRPTSSSRPPHTEHALIPRCEPTLRLATNGRMACPPDGRTVKVRTLCIGLSVISALVLASCSAGPGRDSQTTARILLIGNSYTFFNSGIDHDLEGLAPTVSATSLAKAG
jgi:hypothetical protein